VAHRLAGDWRPSAAAFRALLDPAQAPDEPGRPYPFFLASPLQQRPQELGPRRDWLAEWKWDGIRAQLIRRRGAALLWSRGEELVSDRFPEIRKAAGSLPDGTVIDGEIVAWHDDAPLPFGELQRRLNRKRVGAKLLRDVPCALIAYDLLERHGDDWRERPLSERRAELEALVSQEIPEAIRLSPVVPGRSWRELAAARDQARDRGVEGLMLKLLESPYRTGRPRGDWWKWKVEPLTLDAVLVYAQRGHGRRASLYTDYTFAVADGDDLVPVAKAYSGLTDAEIQEVDRFVRRNITDRFGPVRAVAPELVFELAFDGIRRSPRHKSGFALRFPRIARWRRDKVVEDIDTVDGVRELLERYG
jgi:DNA ligase-1